MFAPEKARAIPLGSITMFRIVNLAQRGADTLHAWHNARVTSTALQDLSDHQLADIGLHRGEISAVAEELARG
jgi:uncharacterized protein YjiS (DUF1127 family)